MFGFLNRIKNIGALEIKLFARAYLKTELRLVFIRWWQIKKLWEILSYLLWYFLIFLKETTNKGFFSFFPRSKRWHRYSIRFFVTDFIITGFMFETRTIKSWTINCFKLLNREDRVFCLLYGKSVFCRYVNNRPGSINAINFTWFRYYRRIYRKDVLTNTSVVIDGTALNAEERNNVSLFHAMEITVQYF